MHFLGVQYSMPLRKKRKSNEFMTDSDNSTLESEKNNDSVNGDDDDGDSEDEDDNDDVDENWLESLGIDSKEVKKMTLSQVRLIMGQWMNKKIISETFLFNQKAIDRTREGRIDSSEESLLLIEGVNIQAFFNVLLNFKSCIPSTGAFAGVPPTLLSPVAFSLATLKSCKVGWRLNSQYVQFFLKLQK